MAARQAKIIYASGNQNIWDECDQVTRGTFNIINSNRRRTFDVFIPPRAYVDSAKLRNKIV